MIRHCEWLCVCSDVTVETRESMYYDLIDYCEVDVCRLVVCRLTRGCTKLVGFCYFVDIPPLSVLSDVETYDSFVPG